jgi:predicted ATPase
VRAWHARRKNAGVGERKRIVLTGGPGAGKTAVLELARKHFRGRLDILHEAASIVFVGGFPRHPEPYARASAQRVIYHVQIELERIAMETPSDKAILCDRGTIDGLAYWPLAEAQFFTDVCSSLEKEIARYDAVIHLRTPARGAGYHKNAVRTEAPEDAELIDERLLEVWKTHPKRFIVDSSTSFMDKAHRAMTLIHELVE